MRTYQVISGDGHIEGPIEFEPYLPEKHRDLAPKLEQRADGVWMWHGRGDVSSIVGSNVYSGLRYDQFVAANTCTYWNPDGSLRPGASPDPAVRLREQDQDGVDAEVLYFPMAAGMLTAGAGGDIEAQHAAVRAYTNFLADYCSVAPDRLIGTMLLPYTGIDDAIAEMEHGHSRGLRAVALQNWPSGAAGPTPDDDQFWAASLDLGMAVAPHISFGNGQVPAHEIHVTPERAIGGFNQLGNPRTTMPIAQLIHAGVFDRFPSLKVYFAESEVSWLAGWLEYIDEFYSRWAPFHGLELPKMPSDYVRDHCRFCMISDRMAVQLRHFIGTEMFMWGSDFPHSVGTWPDSTYILGEFFEGVPDEERRQILVLNACNLFGLDPDRELTATPAG
jgi:predicted TIM-barrel fold metal-dependent hydrolase